MTDANPYRPDNRALAQTYHEIQDEWHAYLLDNFGDPEAVRVTVCGVELTAMLHPLNNWMAVVRNDYADRLQRAAWAVCAHRDGRLGEADMQAARNALRLSMAVVERAKAIDARTEVVNASPFVVEEIGADRLEASG